MVRGESQDSGMVEAMAKIGSNIVHDWIERQETLQAESPLKPTKQSTSMS